MTTFGYLRVSTTEQADSGAGMLAQRDAILREAEVRGWGEVEFVEDGGFSGGSLDRPGIAGLLPRLGRGDTLAVAKLDRLSRSLVDAVGLLEQSAKRGWALVALDLNVDTSTPTGRLVAGVMSAVGSWERDVIRARTKDAMAAKKRAGGVRYGHRSTLPEKVQDEVERLVESGLSRGEVARRMTAAGVSTAQGSTTWYASTVGSVLRSRANDRLAGLIA
ncbi:recombinase family protein [Aeromicrobium fastidiosum]|uniref:recombinase family protein n=1 Tax=Aeromicrobium fastidiosum TaxID=52699 RepID=UPI00202333B9|nr:recombinase family protein [Aeromicrobium fastidiosum]MCL8251363.1 recombinase family protein [Aeromicrobium fastidiosum]